jgi:hypothetical protein
LTERFHACYDIERAFNSERGGSIRVGLFEGGGEGRGGEKQLNDDLQKSISWKYKYIMKSNSTEKRM